MTSGAWWTDPEDLDETQNHVLGLPADGKYLITGKPGSGKTNLLVLRAAYLIRAGSPDIKVVTWGRLISEFIATASERHGLTSNQLTTFMSWGVGSLQEADVEVELSGDYRTQIRQLIQNLDDTLNDGGLAHYDGILLDEVQDYPTSAVRIFDSLTERLFLAGDDNQRIYQQGGSLQAFEEIVDETIHLPYHYRNGRRICLVAEGIKGENDYATTSRYDENALPSSVRLIQCDSLEEQVNHALQHLEEQLRSYPNEFLGVLVPRTDDLAEVVELFRNSDLEERCQFQTRAEGNEALDESQPIIVSTIAAAKGLEYRAVHILGMEGLSTFPPAKRRNVAYTAVTRAKTTLYGYYSGVIEGWLRSAFQRGQDRPPNPSVRDLFS